MSRYSRLENNNWKFLHGDLGEAKEADYDDAEWYDIGLPHSFGIPYYMEGEFYVGYGCYRKTLLIEPEWLDRRILLEFQGSFQVTEVYVNGQLAGTHRGGYTAFVVELTEYVRAGENQLFVRVNNLWDARLAPRAGEHVFNGGIYRDVTLIVTDPVHIAWYGTEVTTPEVSAQRATVRIRTEVQRETSNQNGLSKKWKRNETEQIRLVSGIFFQGEVIAERAASCELSEGQTEFLTQEFELTDPRLWHPDHPNLYTLQSRIYVGEELRDSCETEFGIRWFRFTADQGFFLNGEHYEIHGANVHQDHAGWSDAVPHTAIRRDIAMVKECGMNFIRGSHYPHHTFFAQECDRQGLLFWSENCFWGTGGPKEEGYWTASGYPAKEEDEEEFILSCEQTLTEMIRTNRNHPSIIVWSMCNEPFFSNQDVMHKAEALVSRLVELSHKLDPTRPAAVGGAQRGSFDRLGDLAGYNGDGASIFIDPGVPNFVSEYGSIYMEDRPGKFEHRYLDGVENDHPWRSGKAIWCAFHHGSILGNMGHMGIIDYARLPLDTWYWYRENLAGIPAPKKPEAGTAKQLRLCADRTEMAGDGTEDVFLMVELLDENGDRVMDERTVELEVVSGGGRFPTGMKYTFSPEAGNFAESLGAVELHAVFGGETVIRAYEGNAKQEAPEGLSGDELCIRVIGEPWPEGKPRRELLPPPYLTGAPERKRLDDIGINRPVFCSSAQAEHPARNVTDGSFQTCWLPQDDTPGQWILVDLEGTKEMQEIVIFFEGIVQERYEVAVSDDRKVFHKILESEKGNTTSDVSIRMNGEKYRYIQISYPEKAAGIILVRVMA